MMYGDIACIQRIESIITLKKIGYEIQLRNQPLKFGIYYVLVNRFLGKCHFVCMMRRLIRLVISN